MLAQKFNLDTNFIPPPRPNDTSTNNDRQLQQPPQYQQHQQSHVEITPTHRRNDPRLQQPPLPSNDVTTNDKSPRGRGTDEQ